MCPLLTVVTCTGLLLNPRLFAGPAVMADRVTLALEYLDYAERVESTPGRSMRDHMMVRTCICNHYDGKNMYVQSCDGKNMYVRSYDGKEHVCAIISW